MAGKSCLYCGGSGKVRCYSCNGMGEVYGNSIFKRSFTCSACSGRGYIPCMYCNGDGYIYDLSYESNSKLEL